MYKSRCTLDFTSHLMIQIRPAALIWQLMRAYTLSVLTRLANTGNPIIEKEIVQWVNNKLQAAGKTSSIRSFQVHNTTTSSSFFLILL